MRRVDICHKRRAPTPIVRRSQVGPWLWAGVRSELRCWRLMRSAGDCPGAGRAVGRHPAGAASGRRHAAVSTCEQQDWVAVHAPRQALQVGHPARAPACVLQVTGLDVALRHHPRLVKATRVVHDRTSPATRRTAAGRVPLTGPGVPSAVLVLQRPWSVPGWGSTLGGITVSCRAL
jgi:hypothetical protein